MAATTTIYRSITLQPFEQFTLPPNSELVSVELGSGSVDSSCTIPELEELTCYEIILMGSDEAGSQSRPYEDDSSSGFFIRTLNVSGVEYDVPDINVNELGQFDLTDLVNYITSNSAISGLFVGINWSTANNDNRGGVSSLCFKTLPSVADTIYLKLETNFPEAGTVSIRFYAQPFGTYTGIGSCSCS